MSLFVPCTQTVTYVGEKTLKTGKDRKGLVRDISEENHAASIRSRNTGGNHVLLLRGLLTELGSSPHNLSSLPGRHVNLFY